MYISFYGRYGGALVEGVVQFKYLGRPLDQTDDNFTVIHHNIKRARKVWVQVRKMLQREGSYTQVSEIFYRAVVQAVILFG